MGKCWNTVFLFGIIFLAVCSCCERKTKEDLGNFLESSIEIPAEMRQIFLGRDTMIIEPTQKTVRLVVYIDSTECSTCMISQLYEYDEIIDYANAIGDNYCTMFIFAPVERLADDVIKLLEASIFYYPVFFDTYQSFISINTHIPVDRRFHTFLLDKNGKVVLAGNPVNNPALWELYKTTITQLIANGGTMPDVEKKD